jgi:hypothetical protein
VELHDLYSLLDIARVIKAELQDGWGTWNGKGKSKKYTNLVDKPDRKRTCKVLLTIHISIIEATRCTVCSQFRVGVEGSTPTLLSASRHNMHTKHTNCTYSTS